jgi:hypothetical protein
VTVSTTASRISYAGNDVTVAFSFPYLFLANTHIVVVLVNDATGVETTKTITTHYTVTGATNPAGGTVTMVTAPATGETLVLYRSTTLDQQVDYQSNDTFPAETHEGALDKLTLIAQENATANSRALLLSSGDTSTDPTLPAPAASQLLGWNADADALINYSQTALDTTLLPTLVANKVLGVNSGATALELKFTVPSASANTVLGWNSGGTDIENKPALLADLTDNLSVGFTTDTETLASDTITPDMSLESIKTRAVAGNVTINFPTNGKGVCHIILTADGSGPYTVTLGTGVKTVGTPVTSLAASTTYIATIVVHTGSLAVIQILEVAA